MTRLTTCRCRFHGTAVSVRRLAYRRRGQHSSARSIAESERQLAVDANPVFSPHGGHRIRRGILITTITKSTGYAAESNGSSTAKDNPAQSTAPATILPTTKPVVGLLTRDSTDFIVSSCSSCLRGLMSSCRLVGGSDLEVSSNSHRSRIWARVPLAIRNRANP